MPTETTTAISCMIFGGVFERFSRLKTCFAHGGNNIAQKLFILSVYNFARYKLCQGTALNFEFFIAGSFPYTFGRIEHGFHCRPDIVAVDNKVPPQSYKHRIYADSLLHDPHALKYLVESLGEVRNNAHVYSSP